MDSLHVWVTYLFILVSVIGYSLERWPIEAVAAASLSAFLLFFALFPYRDAAGFAVTSGDLLAGFANPALITVLALLIVGQGLFATDAMAQPTQLLSRIGGTAGAGAIAVVLLTAAVLSAFLNNTPVVVIFIPILTMLATQRGISPSRVFMPLSFLSILGGVTTLIGSSTNLLVAGVAARSGITLDFFDFTIPGLAIAVVGGIYVIKVMPRILTPREGPQGRVVDAGGKQFLGEIDITEEHAFVGSTARAGLFTDLGDLMPRMILRDDETFLPPFDGVSLQPGDRLIVTATRRAFSKALAAGNLTIKTLDPSGYSAEQRKIGPDMVMAEAVVAPGSRYAGRTMQFSGLRTQFGITLFGLQRKSRMARSALSEIRLEPGDTLLLCGREAAISSLKGNHDLLLLEYSAQAIPQSTKAKLAVAIFLGIIAGSATGLLPIDVLAVTGAVLMVATGCLTVGEAARSVDRSIFMLVGAAIAAATALERTGGAAMIAEGTVAALDGQSPTIILSALFLVIAIMTNFLSNNATAVLFTPIALDIANRLGAPPQAFLACVIFAANASFATPIGYQTNLMVMGPGRYRFVDFAKAGVPLVILVWLTFSIVGPWYYSL
ncbi:MAG: SLC13 family permease [Aurantimonas coralicida]|uniref:Putative transporter n=1 Tax=Aurantimonas coralicida TaxID=182270 RepID=A0A0N7KXH6_9HYPH|nr:SLC13 family permease [Aurantimonas coralicida]MCC4299368.1 SLC13 family permease [Aurantimonas coralicida]MCD1644245.1 SLC13 family permease [Aurantimonas coralicida]BAT26945.1 putative transporter [Aurantimonas coralicida]